MKPSFSQGQYDRLAKALMAEGAGPVKTKADLEAILAKPAPADGQGDLSVDRDIIQAAVDHFDAKTEHGKAFYPHLVASAAEAFLNPQPQIQTQRGVRARDRAKQVAPQLAADIDKTIRHQIEYGKMQAVPMELATVGKDTIAIGKDVFVRRDKGEMPEIAGVTVMSFDTLTNPGMRFQLQIKTHDRPNNTITARGPINDERANPGEHALAALKKNHGYRILGTKNGPQEGTMIVLFSHKDFGAPS